MLAAPSLHAMVQVWFSPTNSGSANGTSLANARQFDWGWLTANHLKDAAADKDVQLVFLPGTHTNIIMADNLTTQWTQNSAVWVKASPDAANDKSQTIARGQFHFYRTGNTGSGDYTTVCPVWEGRLTC